MEEEIIKENDDVLLILPPKRKYLIKLKKDQKLHTHKGYILHNDIIGKKYGEYITSNLNIKFFISKPSISDYIEKIQRKTQIIYPKDAAYIILIGNITSNSLVVEIGTGSGALTCVLANFVKPNGHVYSYEIREDFINLAKKNLERLNLIEYVTLKLKDASQGIDEKNVDCIIMDVPNPWDIIPKVKHNLKGSGKLISFVLTTSQLEKTLIAFKENKFEDIQIAEILERKYQVEPNKIRPLTRMIGHTGYIIWGRRTFQ